jgi:hypothetical protein
LTRGYRLAWSRIPSLYKEVHAWGAGGRGFKSHWPHCDISSLIGFTRTQKEVKLDRCKSKGKNNNQLEENPMHIHYFIYAVRAQVTRDYYLRRLQIFFNHINLLPHETLEERCNQFAANGIRDPNWAFSSIVKFLQFQKERVEKEEITGTTLRNFAKAIKLFCEMSDIPIAWKKINRGLHKIRRYANDRAPTIEEIQKICEYLIEE